MPASLCAIDPRRARCDCSPMMTDRQRATNRRALASSRGMIARTFEEIAQGDAILKSALVALTASMQTLAMRAEAEHRR